MPLEVAQVRRRVQNRLAELKRWAADRRERVAAAERAYAAFLTDVAAPAFSTFAQSLSAEGYPYRVITPGGTLRLVSERSNKTYIEVRLETSTAVPTVVAEVSRERGHRVIADDRTIAEGTAIDALTDESVVEFLLEAMADVIER